MWRGARGGASERDGGVSGINWKGSAYVGMLGLRSDDARILDIGVGY